MHDPSTSLSLRPAATHSWRALEARNNWKPNRETAPIITLLALAALLIGALLYVP